MALTQDDLDRHRRHIMLKEIGGPGVQKLKSAHVALVGAGALGGPCALYLAAAGLGRIDIHDDDLVERSNLQRQIQFAEADIGAPKAERLAERCRMLNPGCYARAVTKRFEGAMIEGDLLIDATDNFETRFALNRLAHGSKRVLVSGAAIRWEGQVSVYASGVSDGAPCYQCLVPSLPPQAETCAEVGVVGAATGVIGARMALETVKTVCNAGNPLIGRIYMFDGLSGESRILKLRPDTECQVCGS